MNTAVKTILLVEIPCHSVILEYFSRNFQKLAENGILYPASGAKDFSPLGYDHYPILNHLLNDNIENALQILHDIKKEISSRAESINALCLLIPGILLYKPEYINSVKKILQRVFPSAAISISFNAVRQDNVIPYIFALQSYTSEACYHAYKDILYSSFDYKKIFRQAKIHTENATACHVHASQDVYPDQQMLVRLNTALGLDAHTARHMASSFRPRHDLTPSRELLRFIAVSIHSDTAPLAPYMPWLTQLYHFTPEAGYAQDKRSLLSPKLRAEIREYFAASNADAAQMLGLERLFPEPEPEPDWEPFMGLTEEAAFRIAERLEPDFAAARLAEFDATPRQYLKYEQRICQQALRDALAPASAPSLPRAPAKQPKLSVLTLTYNHAPYITECIESVIAQKTDFPIQHIIADDASDDGTQEIILEYAAKHPHIIPMFQETRSTGWLNIKALFEMARTEYAALCDGDDYFTDQNKLQTQMDFLNAHQDCALCFHPVRVVYEDDTGRSRVFPPLETLPRGVRPFYYLADLLRFNMIQTNSVMYRWRFRGGLPEWFRPELTPGDWYWHLLHAETGKIGFINKIMSAYRRHKDAMYYSAEINTRLHRVKNGMQELEQLSAVNKHFNNRYMFILGDMANGVFSEILMHSHETGEPGLFDAIMEKYPKFAAHFMTSLNALRE